jgi:2-amino-4-hydroxy-6-hydroxymethyldihydropteridine diphosphokinase
MTHAAPAPHDPAATGQELVAIGLGANLGDARAALAWALQQLQAHPRVTLRQVSSLYRTRPVEAEGPDYLNAVALLHTSLEPEALLRLLQDLELQAGRERPYRHAPRTLDLDLLLYGQRVLNSATLTLPHPRMHQRRFVLAPLAELAPDRPVAGGGTAHAAAERLEDQSMEVVSALHWWGRKGA